MWPYTLKHNHEVDRVVFVPTQDIVEEKSAAAAAVIPAEAISPATESTASDGSTADLKLRLKKRFAAIGRKLQKHWNDFFPL